MTKIQLPVLGHAYPIDGYDVSLRKQWAAGRTTTRPEDRAYCLIGIMGVNMLPIYGEGENAWARLEDELTKLNARSSQDREVGSRKIDLNGVRLSAKEGSWDHFAPYNRYVAAMESTNSLREALEALDLEFQSIPQPSLRVGDVVRSHHLRHDDCLATEREERYHQRRPRGDSRRQMDHNGRIADTTTNALVAAVDHSSSQSVLPERPQRSGQAQPDPGPQSVQHFTSLTPPPTPPEQYGFQSAPSELDDGVQSRAGIAPFSAYSLDDQTPSDEAGAASATTATDDEVYPVEASRLADSSSDESLPAQHLPGPARRRFARPVSMMVPDTQKTLPVSMMILDTSTSSARLPLWSLAGYMDLFHAAASQAMRVLSLSSEQGIQDLTQDDLAYGDIE